MRKIAVIYCLLNRNKVVGINDQKTKMENCYSIKIMMLQQGSWRYWHLWDLKIYSHIRSTYTPHARVSSHGKLSKYFRGVPCNSKQLNSLLWVNQEFSELTTNSRSSWRNTVKSNSLPLPYFESTYLNQQFSHQKWPQSLTF